LGQHNEAVWCDELGVERQDYLRLKDQGVI
jgi:hypothetical protein